MSEPMTRAEIEAAGQAKMRACLTDDLTDAVATVPAGWWWSGGICSVSCHASIGPDSAYIFDPLIDRFDAGFHADLAHPCTLADAVRDCVEQARIAVRDFLREGGDGTERT